MRKNVFFLLKNWIKNLIFDETDLFNVTFPVKSEILRIFRIRPNGIKIWKKSTTMKVVKKLIWLINKSEKISEKKIIQQKNR